MKNEKLLARYLTAYNESVQVVRTMSFCKTMRKMYAKRADRLVARYKRETGIDLKGVYINGK